MRRTTRRFTRKPKKETIWISVALQAVAAGVTTATTSIPLVGPGDWTRGINFEKGATLKAIRGWYQVAYAPSSTSLAPSWYMAIHKAETDETTTAWNFTTSTSYNDQDVLYVDGGHYALSAAAPAAATPWVTQSQLPLARHLQVKTNRKLNSDDFINLWFGSPSAAQDWTISGVFRSLIELP